MQGFENMIITLDTQAEKERPCSKESGMHRISSEQLLEYQDLVHRSLITDPELCSCSVFELMVLGMPTL